MEYRDEKLLNQIFNKYKSKNQSISGVIHFAGLKSISESLIDPLNYWDQILEVHYHY